IYRGYIGFVCFDANERAYLEAIYFMVEVLDKFFDHVCKVNFVFNFHTVCGLSFLSLTFRVRTRTLF
ncbi:hypothetical protein K438DRAFT_1594682, partial [Mycena galopus ATCC 62051]